MLLCGVSAEKVTVTHNLCAIKLGVHLHNHTRSIEFLIVFYRNCYDTEMCSKTSFSITWFVDMIFNCYLLVYFLLRVSGDFVACLAIISTFALRFFVAFGYKSKSAVHVVADLFRGLLHNP